jgi:hypothetical protein
MTIFDTKIKWKICLGWNCKKKINQKINSKQNK